MTLVLRPARATPFGRLTEDISATEVERIPVDNTRHYPDGAFQYVRIDEEWIRYGAKDARSFREVTRGVRDTVSTEHLAGAVVVYGTTFRRVIRIPGARDSRWKLR